MTTRNFHRTNRRGFTLVELMIVIGIIAILAAMIVPSTLHARQQAQLTSCEGNLRALWTAKVMAEAESKHAGLYVPGPNPYTGWGTYVISGSLAYRALAPYCDVASFRCPLGGNRNGAYYYWELHEASYESLYPGSVIYTSSFSCQNSDKHPGCAPPAALGGWPRSTAKGLFRKP